YDATTTATLNVSGAAFAGVVSGDDVTIGTGSETGPFDTTNCGSTETVQVAGVTKSGTDAGNYVIAQPTASADITQASAGLAWTAPQAITFGTSLGGAQLSATAAQAGTFAYAPAPGTRPNAGPHTLSVTFTPTSPNYAAATAAVQIQVNPRPVTVTSDDIAVTFGGTVTPTFGVVGLSAPDSVSSVTQTYAGTDSTTYAGSTNAPVTAGSYSVTPSAVVMASGLASNYSITYVTGALVISRAAQTTLVATATATTLTYSAPTKATTTLGTTGGDGDGAVSFAVVSGSSAVCSVSGATLTVESAGTCQVTAAKAQGTNHLAATSAPLSFTLNQASQTVTLASVADRTYGDADFSVSASSSSGLTVMLQAGPASVCDNPSGHTVRILSVGTCTVDALQPGNTNYLAAATQSRSFLVSPKNLTVTGLSADSRTYDGSLSATALVSPHMPSAVLNGVVSRAGTADSVSIDSTALSAVFASKTVGSAKPVTVSGIALSGPHAHRYTVSQPTGLTANVTRRNVSVSGVTVVTRQYDATTVALLDTSAHVLSGVLPGDTVSLDSSAPNAVFADADASANPKTVTTPGLALGGADGPNYQLVLPTLLGLINKADASVTFAATRTVTYNGTPRALASTTTPAALNVVTKYTGSGSTVYAETVQAPTNAGTYSVNGTINETNYAGSANAAWRVTKQSTQVTIDPAHLTRTFDGTVRTPAVSTSPQGKNVSVTYTGTGGTTYSSQWAPANAGTYTVTATVQEGNFEGSRSETLTIARAAQSPLDIVSTGTVAYGSTLPLVTSGGSGSGAVTYSVLSGPCTVDPTGGVLAPTGTGTCSVSATRDASQNYSAVSSPSRTVTATKGLQTVAFTTEMPSLPVTGGTYSPSAVSSVGLPTVISVTSGSGTVCTLAGGTVTFRAGGTCTLTASQAGNSLWDAAPSVDQIIEIGKMSQAVTFPQPAPLSHGGQPSVLAATASSGLAVTYSVSAGASSCSVSTDGVVAPGAIGTCTVTASQAGDQTYAAAAPVSRTVTVTAALPGAPHISSVSAGDSTITVGYAAPFSDGGSTILSYKVTAVSSGAPTVSRSDCSASTMSCTLVGLTNGQSYTVAASAVTVAGVGDASETVQVLVPAPTVDAPVSVVGTRASTTLDIRWEDAPAFDPATFQQYDVYVRPVGGDYGSPIAVVNAVDGPRPPALPGWAGPVVLALSVTTRHAQATNLNPAVLYQVKIVTVTTQRATETATNTAAALVMPLANPDTPRDLTVDGAAGSATVSWRAPASHGGTPVTSYAVTTNRGACAKATPTATRCTITGLSPGDTLTVSVTAANSIGSSAPATAAYS
ncbi:MAG: YDG domain-containing protein, partial [Actinomycetota bacterium]